LGKKGIKLRNKKKDFLRNKGIGCGIKEKDKDLGKEKKAKKVINNDIMVKNNDNNINAKLQLI